MYAAKIIRMLPIASFLQQIYALLIFTSLSLKYNKTIVDKTFDINAASPMYPKTKNEGRKDELYIDPLHPLGRIVYIPPLGQEPPEGLGKKLYHNPETNQI